MITVHSITFDASRYRDQGVRDGVRLWFLPEGGGVGIFHFPRKPDLPPVPSLADLHAFYEALCTAEQVKMVDFRLLQLDGVQSIKLIAKGLDPGTRGTACIGSWTIPFREFSFVVKIQCYENGITGVREAILLDEALRKGIGRIESGRYMADGWSTDDEKFDDRFPEHPLSCVRRELLQIASSLRIDSTVKREPQFGLPSDSQPHTGPGN